ncbi:haloacid dehalogenase type II [Roseiterribacter gracilis]
MQTKRLVVFDAYGTLFDVHAAAAIHADRVGPDFARMSASWRQKQLEYSWTRSLMRRHADFWTCTQEALDWAMALYGISPANGLRGDLLAAYRNLRPYDDAGPMLDSLRAAGFGLAILSNGTHDMLRDAVTAAGWNDLFAAILSIDDAGIFKPDPRVYTLVETATGVDPASTVFVSGNPWDSAGAASAGFRVVRLARASAPPEYMFASRMAEIASLAKLPALLGC